MDHYNNFAIGHQRLDEASLLVTQTVLGPSSSASMLIRRGGTHHTNGGYSRHLFICHRIRSSGAFGSTEAASRGFAPVALLSAAFDDV